jgi:hypothetical protein
MTTLTNKVVTTVTCIEYEEDGVLIQDFLCDRCLLENCPTGVKLVGTLSNDLCDWCGRQQPVFEEYSLSPED